MSHATHVIIRGHVFTHAEKAPFAVSGESILGALEYDEVTEKTKCHECGEWQSGLGNHIKIHGLKRVDYNQRHGLRPSTPISSPELRQKHAVAGKRNSSGGRGLTAPSTVRAARQANHNRKGRHMAARVVENFNERARCAAQLIFRIQVLAAELGHTPTHKQLEESGIGCRSVKERFGTVDRAMIRAGLVPNSYNPVPSPLPNRFPYPKDYGRVRLEIGDAAGGCMKGLTLCGAVWAGDQPEPIRCQLPEGHPIWPNAWGYHVGFTSEGVLVRFPEEPGPA